MADAYAAFPDIDLAAVSARIDYDCAAAVPTPAALAGVVRAMCLSIPFEQLDVALGRGISTDPRAIYEKLVVNKRGGYCFEVNGLLFSILKAMGFATRAVMARVLIGGGVTGFTHIFCLVDLEGDQYICDCGFGASSPRVPVPLSSIARDADGKRPAQGRPIAAFPDALRLVDDEDVHVHAGGLRLQHLNTAAWERDGRPDLSTDAAVARKYWGDMYVFNPADPVYPADVDVGNAYVSTHLQGNFFTNTRLVVQLLPTGLRIMEGNKMVERTRVREDDLIQVLGAPTGELRATGNGAGDGARAEADGSCYVSIADATDNAGYLDALRARFGIDLTYDHRLGCRGEAVTLASFTKHALAQAISFLK